MQNTVKTSVFFSGVGLHSGKPSSMVLHPAPANHGIRFKRTDIALGDTVVLARWDFVERTALCTRLVNAAGVSVSTVEHIMAALAGSGVHNVLVELNGPEVPIMDGSSADFLREIMAVGIERQSVPVRAFEVLTPVTVEANGAQATLLPCDRLKIEFNIDFAEEAIGKQRRMLDLRNGAFARELCDSRTFCRRVDVENMQAKGLALGGVPGRNAVVFDGPVVQAGEHGLRHSDEPVRHKMLDALGDLALAGGPIFGHYIGDKSGHSLTNTLLRARFAAPNAVREVACDPIMTARLPGHGLVWNEIPAQVREAA